MLRIIAAGVALGFCVSLAIEPTAQAASRVPSAAKNAYIVVLRDAPVASRRARDSSRRASELTARHDSLLNAVGGARKLYSYSHALNGFAAELTRAQAEKLRADANVISVARNEIRKLHTLTLPAFLGLSASNGAWDQAGGGAQAGDNVIVGVIDTGIWPEHPSFQPRPVHGGPAPDWNGSCESGEQFPATSCNNKLIGARWFNAGFGGDAAIKSLFPYEFLSPRAAEGHGVHTAATAVGNFRVEAKTGGVNLGRVSGMAPAARLAVYKACWGFSDDPNAGCSTVDSVAAIDQAVADGVDVINFSIDGSLTSVVDPIEFAFLIAADAGVFVATSAGNGGRLGPGTVQHNAPWVTSVGIATHDRRYKAAVVFANGRRFEGSSLDHRGLAAHAVVLARDAGAPGQDPALAALCLPGTLNPSTVEDKIVVCDRGENVRIEKSHVVQDSGGVGMILVNPASSTVDADIHAVPTVHLDHVAGAALKRFLWNNPSTKARLTPRKIVTGPAVPAPNLAADSSRGPSLAAAGDILKPDLVAPGVDVLAAYSPLRTGLDYEFLGGSSASSAVVAGIAAIVKQLHPDWSPAAIKSALMTTAVHRRNDGLRIRENEAPHAAASVFGIGAGLVQPTPALDPGLVYDSSSEDWLRFICGTGEACFPPLEALDPSNLNSASIAIGSFIGKQVVRRTVTNVGTRTVRYTVGVNKPPGFEMSVSPSAFTIAPGASRAFEVRFIHRHAPLDRYAFGSITWHDGVHTVRSPIAILPKPLAAPGEIAGNDAPLAYDIQFGYTGVFRARSRGLVPANTMMRIVQDDPANEINTALATGTGVALIPIEVAAGVTHARFSLFDGETDGNDDLDLYVFDANGEFVAGSSGATASEEINLVNPAPGTYLVVVHGFETEGPDARFTLFSWILGTAATGNMGVSAPTHAKVGQNATVRLRFSNLKAGVRYLGSVAYSGAKGMPPPTLVRIDR